MPDAVCVTTNSHLQVRSTYDKLLFMDIVVWTKGHCLVGDADNLASELYIYNPSCTRSTYVYGEV